MYYCIISLCSAGRLATVEGSVGCYIYNNSAKLRDRLMIHWFMVPTLEEPYRTIYPQEGDDEYKDKVEYVDHVMRISYERQDELHHFPRLSLNSSCCEVFLYCTNDKNKIIDNGELEQYVILTREERNKLYGR